MAPAVRHVGASCGLCVGRTAAHTPSALADNWDARVAVETLAMADPCPLCSPINRMVPRFSPTRDPICRPVRTRGQKDAVSKVKFHLPPANDCIDLVDRGSCRPSSSSRSTCDKLRGWHRACTAHQSCWQLVTLLRLQSFGLERGGLYGSGWTHAFGRPERVWMGACVCP